MHSEDTVLSNRMSNSEETVVNNPLNSGAAVVKNQGEENDSMDGSGRIKKDQSNSGKRIAAVAAGTATAATATAAAGMYFTHEDGEDIEAEEHSEDPVAEPASSGSSHASSAPQPQPQPAPSTTPEPEPTPEPILEPQPIAEPAPEPEQPSESEPDVPAVEPEVEILGVEVVHTENGDMTLGGITVNGEDYVLVDVDGGDFDVAWHDDNHDQQIQETELIDISGDHISVNDFAQAAEHDNDDYTSPDEYLIAENDMDPMEPGEIDYMDTSDTSGLV